ncbi:LacI family DNA-binding transcriptional regulator [Paraburkholderia sp. D1E]|uniref:LacI family DNA-binding transcriptional regulator n=1 Tax=Paraburkholderia sp. D1E TaxID=3461398 RepID=UPI0040467813
MKTSRTVTLNDVAAEAKTSNATVSNYVNKTKTVSPVTARRIQSAIDKLGYQKDSMAAWFKTARAELVIIAVADADTTFFSDVADAIEDECEAKGWSALRVKIRTLEKMLKGSDMSAILKRAAGVIVLGHQGEWISDLDALSAGLPLIALNWDVLSGFGSQGLEDHLAEGSFRAMEILYQHGHREIGLVTGPLDLPRGQELMAGVKRFAQAHEVNLRRHWILETSYAFHDARDKVLAMFNTGDIPSAFLTFGPQFAFGVFQAAWQRGLRVPTDLSIISYIDTKQAEFSSPPLTTVSPSLTQLAGHVVARLDDFLAGKAKSRSTILEIIEHQRGSVGRISR